MKTASRSTYPSYRMMVIYVHGTMSPRLLLLLPLSPWCRHRRRHRLCLISHCVYTMKGSKQFNSIVKMEKNNDNNANHQTGNDDFVNIIRVVVVVVLLSIENDEERKSCGIELKRKSNESFDVCARICDMMATPAIVQSNGRDDDDNNKKTQQDCLVHVPICCKVFTHRRRRKRRRQQSIDVCWNDNPKLSKNKPTTPQSRPRPSARRNGSGCRYDTNAHTHTFDDNHHLIFAISIHTACDATWWNAFWMGAFVPVCVQELLVLWFDCAEVRTRTCSPSSSCDCTDKSNEDKREIMRNMLLVCGFSFDSADALHFIVLLLHSPMLFLIFILIW